MTEEEIVGIFYKYATEVCEEDSTPIIKEDTFYELALEILTLNNK